MSKVKKKRNETKQQKYKRREISDGLKKSTIFASTSVIFQNKRHPISQIPEKVLNVDASVGKRGKLGG